MEYRDRIEFYEGGDKLVARVKSSMVPAVGQMISIRKKTYKVANVTFALDHADEPFETGMRCNVDLDAV